MMLSRAGVICGLCKLGAVSGRSRIAEISCGPEV